MININIYKFSWSLIITILLIILIIKTPFYNYPFQDIKKEISQIITYSDKWLNTSDWLIIINWPNNQNIKIDVWLNYIPFNIDNWQKISFATKQIYSNTFLFLQFTGNIIKIYPQSAILIQKTSNNINIIIINWIVQHVNTDPNYNISFSWDIQPLLLSLQNNLLSSILNQQNIKQKNDIIKIYWWNIILNSTFDNIIKNLIKLFYKINPNKYKDNLDNYNKFNTYIKNIDSNFRNDYTLPKQQKQNISQDILKQFNKWLSKIFNSF